MTRLRRKLEETGLKGFIETRKGMGYLIPENYRLKTADRRKGKNMKREVNKTVSGEFSRGCFSDYIRERVSFMLYLLPTVCLLFIWWLCDLPGSRRSICFWSSPCCPLS